MNIKIITESKMEREREMGRDRDRDREGEVRTIIITSTPPNSFLREGKRQRKRTDLFISIDFTRQREMRKRGSRCLQT